MRGVWWPGRVGSEDVAMVLDSGGCSYRCRVSKSQLGHGASAWTAGMLRILDP
jgi:hypothetical protein